MRTGRGRVGNMGSTLVHRRCRVCLLLEGCCEVTCVGCAHQLFCYVRTSWEIACNLYLSGSVVRVGVNYRARSPIMTQHLFTIYPRANFYDRNIRVGLYSGAY
jgi:hypothetical protein